MATQLGPSIGVPSQLELELERAFVPGTSHRRTSLPNLFFSLSRMSISQISLRFLKLRMSISLISLSLHLVLFRRFVLFDFEFLLLPTLPDGDLRASIEHFGLSWPLAFRFASK